MYITRSKWRHLVSCFQYEGVKVCKAIIATPTMKSIGAEPADGPSELCGQHAYDTDDYWACMIRRNALTIFHSVGTCKMGAITDNTTVVDPQLRYWFLKMCNKVNYNTQWNLPMYISYTLGVSNCLRKKYGRFIIFLLWISTSSWKGDYIFKIDIVSCS